MPYNHIVRDDPYRWSESMRAARESALQAVLHLLQPIPSLAVAHRRELLTTCLWKWTEASGVAPNAKFNLRYVTLGALNSDVPALINHEHVWTRKWIINRLLEPGKSWSPGMLRDFLDQFGVACIVTVEEHARLSAATGQGWQRYARAGIEVWDLQASALLELDPSAVLEDSEPTLGEANAPDAADANPVESDGNAEQVNVVAPPSAVSKQQLAPGNGSVHTTLDELAGVRANLLKRLVDTATAGGGVCFVSHARVDGQPGQYVRLHDTMVEEPTHAAAFIHWTGRVSFALVSADLPSYLLTQPSVAVQTHATYGIRCKVDDDSSLKVAEALSHLALEKIRDAYAAGDE